MAYLVIKMQRHEIILVCIILVFVTALLWNDETFSHDKNLYIKRPYRIQYDCARRPCSWEESRPSVPDQELRENATIEIKSQITDPPLSCLPSVFGYKPEDAAKLFKHKDFEKCNTSDTSWIDFDIKSNLFTLNCSSEVLKKSKDPNFYGQYVLGDSMYKEKQGRYVFERNMKKYPGSPVKLSGNEEFVYASCYKDFSTPELVDYKAREKPEVKKRVKEAMERIQKETNDKFGVNLETKPLTVIHLLVDSLSRPQFYRKFPKTIEFLKNDSRDSYMFFDYKINNVMGNNSPPNLMPWITGNIEYEERKDAVEDFLGPTSLYSLIGQQGFVTMIGSEFCHRFLSWYMGEKLNVDHIMSSFWCAGTRYSGHWIMSQDRRCIGQHYSHKYALDYILQFNKNYAGLNQWVFVDIITAHENSGMVISTLDEDLLDFLQSFLSTDQEFVLYVEADHGMRYGDWFRLVDGAMEHKLPSLFIFASSSVIDRISGAKDNLDHNSYRLVSKFDLRLTDLHLSKLPYYQDYTKKSPEYQEWISGTQSSGNAISLLMEKIPNTRTCYDINIPPFFCSCLEFKHASITPSLVSMAQEALWNVNYLVRNRFKSQSEVCKALTLKEVLQAQEQELDEHSQNYKLLITINESPHARIELVIMFSVKRIPFGDLQDNFGAYPYFLEGKGYFRLLHMRRLDSYVGMCEDVAMFHGLKGEYCVCEALEKVLWISPTELEDTLKSRFVPALSKTGQSCSDACRENGGVCTDDMSFEMFNKCEYLKTKTCEFTDNPAAPQVVGKVGFLLNPDVQSSIPRCQLIDGERMCSCLKQVVED